MAGISIRQAALMNRRLATGLHAGVPIVRLWEMETARGGPQQQKAAQTVLEMVRKGHQLGESMAASRYYPPIMLQLVDVGERSGKLEAVFQRLADHFDHTVAVRRTFLQSIAWPAIQLAIAIMIIGLLIWIMGAVLPRGIDGEPIDLLGFGLYGSTGLLIYLLIVGSVAGLIALAYFALKKGWLGDAPAFAAMKIPVISKCLETIALARLAWTMSITLNSGVDARRSMAMSLRSTMNPYYTRFVEPADKVILYGGEFHEALGKTGVIPDELVDTLAAAELAGTQAESMTRLSSEYQDRAQSSMRLLGALATGLVWMTVAGILILLIFRLAMFYIGTLNDAVNMTI